MSDQATAVLDPAAPEPEPEHKRSSSAWRRNLLIPALAILLALVVGGLVMIFTDPETLRTWASAGRNLGAALSASWTLVSDAYYALFKSSLGSPNAISETLTAATPLIFAGLSVSLAFRAGLFNIGAEGQLLVGSMFACYVGFTFNDLPAPVLLPMALLAGFAGGAAWGFIPGFLKARTGAHEVIMTIMLNFIALRLTDYLLSTEVFRRPNRTDPISKPVAEAARLPSLGDYRVHLGFVLALLAAWAVWWLLFRSTIGFRFRAVGLNPSAASYAGISVGGTWMLAMSLAGGLSGLAGTSNLLGVQYSMTSGFAGYGFDAIALALLGRTHPFGVVLSALLFGVLRAGAVGMQAATSIPVDIIIVIQGLVILFVAAPEMVRAIFRIKTDEGVGKTTIATSWGS